MGAYLDGVCYALKHPPFRTKNYEKDYQHSIVYCVQ